MVRQPAAGTACRGGLVVDHVDLADHARGTYTAVDLPQRPRAVGTWGSPLKRPKGRKGRGYCHRPFGSGCSPGEPSAISRVDTERHRFKTLPFDMLRSSRCPDAAALHLPLGHHDVLRGSWRAPGARRRSGVVRAVAVVDEHAFQRLGSVLGPIADHHAGVAVDVGHGGTRCCSSAGAACMGLGAATAAAARRRDERGAASY